MIDPKYLIYHDLIGLEVYAKKKSGSHDSEYLNIGMVIDDTQNMLVTEKNEKIKQYIKKNYLFRFKIYEDFLEVNGLKIVGLPENRLRSLKKKKWLRR